MGSEISTHLLRGGNIKIKVLKDQAVLAGSVFTLVERENILV